MAHISEDQLQEFKDTFNLFDKDGSGSINTKDLGTVLRALGQKPAETEVQELVQRIDPSNRGTFNFNEFVNLMKQKLDEQDDGQVCKYFSKTIFFQILWKSRCHILVTFPSHLH